MDNIKLQQSNFIATITVNRPEKLNALNKQTIQEISNVLDELVGDNQVRVIVITGSGDKAFVAGADISEFASFSIENGTKLSVEGHEKLFNKIENSHKPVIAAINGFALGGGLELAMACHFRTASSKARMGLPEVTLGVIPGYGGTQRLPQLVGKGRAYEMIFTGGMVGAERALEIGLVNHVFSHDSLVEETMKIAQQIALNSPSAIKHAIAAVNAGFEEGINGYEAEIRAFGKSFGTEDFIEGTTAFLNKIKPKFTGK